METTKEKIVIDFNDWAYNTNKNLQDKLLNISHDLKIIADSVIGGDEIKDVSKFLENPSNYLICRYYELYAHLFPPTATPVQIFEQNTSITVEKIDDLKNEFWDTYKKMAKYQPEITRKGISTRVEKERFNYYLDESKANHYKALEDFLEAARALKEFDKGQDINLVRFSSSLRIDGVTAKINPTNFYAK